MGITRMLIIQTCPVHLERDSSANSVPYLDTQHPVTKPLRTHQKPHTLLSFLSVSGNLCCPRIHHLCQFPFIHLLHSSPTFLPSHVFSAHRFFGHTDCLLPWVRERKWLHLPNWSCYVVIKMLYRWGLKS